MEARGLSKGAKLLLFVVAMAITLSLVVLTPTPARAALSRNAFEDCLLDRVNHERSIRGLAELQMADDLVPEVQDWSRWMRFNDFVHMPSSVRNDILPGSTTGWGENIAMHGNENLPDCDAIHDMWMNSSGHRQNILGSSFRYAAIGTYVDGSGWWATQLFFNAANYTSNNGDTASPLGWFEDASDDVDAVSLRGWALDPDTPHPIRVHVYVDGSFHRSVVADIKRPDVEAAYGNGSNHGFATTISAPAGHHQVCVYAINAPTKTGNPLLGCKKVKVSSEHSGTQAARAGTAAENTPFGWLDEVALRDGLLSLRGWAIDADFPSEPVGIHVYVDGVFVAGGSAGLPRPDVDGAFGMGKAHGFSIATPIDSGSHRICLYAINLPSKTNNTLLGCKTVA